MYKIYEAVTKLIRTEYTHEPLRKSLIIHSTFHAIIIRNNCHLISPKELIEAETQAREIRGEAEKLHKLTEALNIEKSSIAAYIEARR